MALENYIMIKHIAVCLYKDMTSSWYMKKMFAVKTILHWNKLHRKVLSHIPGCNRLRC